MLLEGKKAVITGGTRGIGYAIAERFIEEGAVVTVFGSRQETADAAVEKLLAAHPDAKVWGRTCDLTSLDAVTEAFKAAAEDMGGLDTVVNNAGISQSTPLLDYTADEWQKVTAAPSPPPALWSPSTASPPAAATPLPSTRSTALHSACPASSRPRASA